MFGFFLPWQSVAIQETMGGKEIRVLFAMAIGCNTRIIPSDKDPPFSKSKVYHTEIKLLEALKSPFQCAL